MPLPKPKTGEKQNDFVGRCVKFVMNEDSNLPQKQAVAMCFNQWKNSRQMHNLQFNFNVPILEKIVEEKTDNSNFMIQGIAINSTVTSNNHKFIPEELSKSAKSLNGVPLLVDHRNEISAIKGRVIKGSFNDLNQNVEFLANVSDEEIKTMIKDGRINSVSVGAIVKEIDEQEGFLIPRGIVFKELSLVAVPADSNATFGIAMKEAYESKVKENNNEVKEDGEDIFEEEKEEEDTLEDEIDNMNLDEKKVTDMESHRKSMGMSVSDFYAAPREPPSSSALPIFDASHCRNAMARFNQTSFKSSEEKTKARKAILKAAKKFKIDTSGFEKSTSQSTSLEDIQDKQKGGEMETEQTISKSEFDLLSQKVESFNSKIESIVSQIEAQTKLISEVLAKSTKTEEKSETKTEEKSVKVEDKVEVKTEKVEKSESKVEESEEVDESDGYKIIQGYGSLGGGAFTLKR